MKNDKSHEEIIYDYILENINISNLNYDSNIFEIGIINSLFAIQLVRFLEKTFDIKFEMDDFLKTMEEDQNLLIQNGINEKDIPLMLDYLHYRLVK